MNGPEARDDEREARRRQAIKELVELDDEIAAVIEVPPVSVTALGEAANLSDSAPREVVRVRCAFCAHENLASGPVGTKWEPGAHVCDRSRPELVVIYSDAPPAHLCGQDADAFREGSGLSDLKRSDSTDGPAIGKVGYASSTCLAKGRPE